MLQKLENAAQNNYLKMFDVFFSTTHILESLNIIFLTSLYLNRTRFIKILKILRSAEREIFYIIFCYYILHFQ